MCIRAKPTITFTIKECLFCKKKYFYSGLEEPYKIITCSAECYKRLIFKKYYIKKDNCNNDYCFIAQEEDHIHNDFSHI